MTSNPAIRGGFYQGHSPWLPRPPHPGGFGGKEENLQIVSSPFVLLFQHDLYRQLLHCLPAYMTKVLNVIDEKL